LRIGITGSQIDDLLQLLDKDGDGRVNYHEFASEFGVGDGDESRVGVPKLVCAEGHTGTDSCGQVCR
jgi:hypothetical protein